MVHSSKLWLRQMLKKNCLTCPLMKANIKVNQIFFVCFSSVMAKCSWAAFNLTALKALQVTQLDASRTNVAGVQPEVSGACLSFSRARCQNRKTFCEQVKVKCNNLFSGQQYQGQGHGMISEVRNIFTQMSYSAFLCQL